ncbi:MAG: ArsC/Spx/MgsR family protein [Albidovulum sp.]
MILYGIPSCDSCRKSQKALTAANHTVTFRDIRADPLDAAEIDELLQSFGDRMINRASTTWRGLSEEMRARSPHEILSAHPTVMKRPVIRDGKAVYLGWTAEVRAQLLS